MANTSENPLETGDRVLREFANEHSAAYTTYGEALKKFGGGGIGSAELAKQAADLYFKETARAAKAAAEVSSTLFSWAVSLTGARTLDPAASTKPAAAPADKK
jgi:hypothetical protein